MMKGISPLVAVVLLIAFTVIVGGIIATWVTTFTKTQTGTVERSVGGTVECTGVYIDVITMSGSKAPLTITWSNPSARNTIYILSVADDNGHACNVEGGCLQPVNNAGLNLDPGQVGTFNVTSNIDADSKIIIKGVCETSDQSANISVEGTCEKGLACWPS